MKMINLLFWISSGCVAGIGVAAAYLGFWDVVALALCGIVTNIMVLFIYNSKK
jgi:hypothetical protein